MDVTLDQLAAICRQGKRARLELFVEPLNATFREYEIDTLARKSAFIAQVAHESGEFRYLRELWGPTPSQERYEGRKDLGNTEPGDGSRFRGRGLIQVTGRANYAKCAEALGLPLLEQPELLEEPINACRSAGWFWSTHGLNALADEGDFEAITRRINGGLNGIDGRLAFFRNAQVALA